MISKFFIVLTFFSMFSSKQMYRIQPKGYNYTDSTEQITLAITQKVSIPLFGAISQTIAFIPNTSTSECSFSNIETKYNPVATHILQRAENSIVTSILPLKSKGLIFLIDQYFSLSTFELTKDQKIKQFMSSRKVFSQNSKSVGSNPKLVSTLDQSTVYILSAYGYSYFTVDSLSTGLKMLKETPQENEQIFKAEIFNNKLYIASGVGGVKVFKIEQNKQLKYLYNLIVKDIYSKDFVIDKTKRLLYLMDQMTGVYVYDISEQIDQNKQPININNNLKKATDNNNVTIKQENNTIINKINPKKDSIPTLSDYLNLSNYTSLNQDIEVFDNTILLMFTRNNKKIVAQFYYDPIDKTFTFIRYFKFQAEISEIVLLKDNFVTIGNQFIGIFPVGIHPKLIKKQLNGFVTVSDIKTAVSFSPPYFVGVTPNSIILAQVRTQKYQVIECILKEKSELEKIVYKANRTTCSNGSSHQYYEYCSYQKQFLISKMQIVAREEIANFVWVLLAVFILAIFAGVITLIIMRHKKVKKIQKMQKQFEQKRQNIALPSQRMSARIGQDSQVSRKSNNPTTQVPMIS